MFKMSRVSYGGTAAVVTSMALISGLGAADATNAVIVSALLIAAFADNLTDSLSIHIFQESEQLDQMNAFTGTITNFIARLLLCISFALLIIITPIQDVAIVTILWGMLILGIITYLIACERKVKPAPEVIKHLLVASAVVLASNVTGHSIVSLLR